MNIQTCKLQIDRIEDGVIVACSDDGQEYLLRETPNGIKENDIVWAEINGDGKIINIKPLPDETEQKKKTIRERLKRLFSKEDL